MPGLCNVAVWAAQRSYSTVAGMPKALACGALAACGRAREKTVP